MNTSGNDKINIINDNGESIECQVLLTIDSEEFGKNYILYTDNTMDDNGNYKTYASIYDPTGETLDLDPVTTDEEWNMIETVLASAQRQVTSDLLKEKEAE